MDCGVISRKKLRFPSDEDLVTAEYVGNGNDAENTDSFSIEVKQLACPQVNYGNYLKNNALDFAPGSYSFDLNTVSNSYEFQFNVNEDDTNRSVLAKLAKLINGAGVGLNAKLVMDDRDMSALKIESVQTGLEEGSKALFPSTRVPKMRLSRQWTRSESTTRFHRQPILLSY